MVKASNLLGLVIAGTIAIVASLIKLMICEPTWDSFDFLMNAEYYFLGKQAFEFSVGYKVNPTMIDARPPLLPFLIAVGFSIFGVDERAGFMASASIFSLGIVGVYLFIRKFLGVEYGVLASLLFAFNPVVYDWSVRIYTNVEMVSIAVLAIYSFTNAIDGDKRWYYVAFPLLASTVLMRFSGVMIVLPILMYAFDKGKIRELFGLTALKGLFAGAVYGVSVSLPWLTYWFKTDGALFLIKIANFFLFRPFSPDMIPYVSPLGYMYYVVKLPQILGPMFPVLTPLFLIGLLQVKNSKGSFARMNVIWFLAFFTLYSMSTMKSLRYGVEFVVPMMAICLSGLRWLVNAIMEFSRSKGLYKKHAQVISVSLLILITMHSACSVVATTSYAGDIKINSEFKEISLWLKDNIPATENVASNYWPHLAWYSQRTVAYAPSHEEFILGDAREWFPSYLRGTSYVVYLVWDCFGRYTEDFSNLSTEQIFGNVTYLRPIFVSKTGHIIVYEVLQEELVE